MGGCIGEVTMGGLKHISEHVDVAMNNIRDMATHRLKMSIAEEVRTMQRLVQEMDSKISDMNAEIYSLRRRTLGVEKRISKYPNIEDYLEQSEQIVSAAKARIARSGHQMAVLSEVCSALGKENADPGYTLHAIHWLMAAMAEKEDKWWNGTTEWTVRRWLEWLGQQQPVPKSCNGSSAVSWLG